ncbi:MAG: class I SAM-dependent methyltransferase [Pseudomonadota bacterium]|jgi:SAM-dependent methyltransferase
MPSKISFDKYAAYALAVQSPAQDARFLRGVYRKTRGREPQTMREDFCGTFEICCEWAKLGSDKRSIGIDLDPEPLSYGKLNYLPKLSPQARQRIKVLKRDVLSPLSDKADVICALNFSYFTFHDRKTLVRYFKGCRRSLTQEGIFVLDIFGGPMHGIPAVDTRRFPKLTYQFEQESFDPITNRTRYSIHFKPDRGRLVKRAFTYDWRMWSITEVRDALSEAGFKESLVYWEGTARNGRGNGIYTPKKVGEPCQAWVAYIIGIA